MVQIDFVALVLGGRRLQRRARAPGQPADAMGAGRGEQPPLTRLGARPTADSGEAVPPPPDPRRPAPPQADHPTTPAERTAWRSGARQPRMRPRKSVSVAVASSVRPRRRPVASRTCASGSSGSSCSCSSASSCCACGRSRWSRARPTPPQVTRNQVRVVERRRRPRRDRRPQRHRAGVEHPAGGDPAVAGRGRAEPRRSSARWRRWSGRRRRRCRRPSTTTSTARTSRYPSRSASPAATVQYLQTHQSRVPGRDGGDRRPADLPAGRDHGDPDSRLRRRHHLAPTSPRTRTRATPRAARSASPGIEAQYEPYLRGRRRAPGARRSTPRATWSARLSTTAPQIGDTVVLNIDTGLQQAVEQDLQQQIAGRPQHLDGIDGSATRRPPTAPSS